MRKIARRSFLIGSVAVAGGAAFGAYMVGRDKENPIVAGAGEAALTPFVKITGDGITLITPHADIGQGAYHMQAMLLAEELDVELDQISVDPGVPAAAYYNTAMAEEAVPFTSVDEGFAAETMRSVMGGVFRAFGVQGTGGSSSVPDSWEKLRAAGAVAREALKAVAAEDAGVGVDALRTEAGAVILPDGTRVPYTDLAEKVAGMPLPPAPELRGPDQWRLIGTETQRLDILGKSTGTLPYGIDLGAPDVGGEMLYATCKVNPRRSALNGYDASAAAAMTGVEQIIPVTNGVAVLATNTWYAFKAAEAVECDWGSAAYPDAQADHWAEVDASFTAERMDRVWRDDGSVEDALSGGADMETYLRAPYAAHQPLEPLSAIVRVSDGRVDVWAGHQMPRFVEQKVAAVVGVETEDVHFHNQYSGGSFGHRLEFDFVTMAAEVAMAVPGVAVKTTLSREEDFATDYLRQIGAARARAKVSDGRVEAFDLEIATTSALASQSQRLLGAPAAGPDTQIPAGAWNLPYAIPSFRVTGYKVPELAPVSSWRSVGAVTAGFFAEAAFDEALTAAGADPLEERLRLVTNDVARGVLEAVGEMSDWGSDLGPGRGRGLAFINSFGVPTAEVVEVTDTGRGIRVDKVFVALDVGRVVDPVNFENHVQGGVVWGLGHAMNSEVTFADGRPEQTNYHMHEGMRLYQCPEIEVRALERSHKIRGVGEPPVPPAAPALANAVFAATGVRLREMPFHHYVDFV
ncbi:MAG: molybdopterin cofactor-binding domain-containing protein [Pseudomonadota bacterium]